MSLVDILLCLFLPPIAVAVRKGIGMDLVINIVLLLIVPYIGGVIHAFWALNRK
ncbi:MAG: YqaE/Pmp3 family membrane protein [Verrucomicrobiota bacterium]